MMKIDEIKTIIKNLSRSQGFYGRLYNAIDENKKWKEVKKEINKAGCKNVVDVVLFFES